MKLGHKYIITSRDFSKGFPRQRSKVNVIDMYTTLRAITEETRFDGVALRLSWFLFSCLTKCFSQLATGMRKDSINSATLCSLMFRLFEFQTPRTVPLDFLNGEKCNNSTPNTSHRPILC